MYSGMIIIAVLFVGAVVLIARNILFHLKDQIQEDYDKSQTAYESLINRKDLILQQRRKIEHDVNEIFTLYELTREIAKQLNETDAFGVFKEKLRENLPFKDCLYLDVLSSEIKKYKESDDYFLFTLKSKRKKIGYLALKGVEEQDKEKFTILGHQFALALRRVKLYQEIEQIAITDSLTGVHTRRYFLERFEEEFRRSASRNIPVSFLMVDVDHFKEINDQHGHLAGDQILREIGGIIKESVREIDIVGRYGGEEFCVVLPDTDREGASFAAERVRCAVEEATIKAYDTSVQTTVSIGIATYPVDAKHTSELIDKADWALYRSKKTGRNRTTAFGIYEES